MSGTTDQLAQFVPRLLYGCVPEPRGWWGEGTLVLADVSGFTRLTEKLARNGKQGAEEIVATISTVFTALLTSSAAAGDVLQFGGDALLLYYQGHGHVERACRAALDMQRTLRRVGGIDSSRGRVRLRMSVGVHTGQPRFELCGGDHLQLHVVGPDASRVAALEKDARAGEVLVSAETAGRLDGARVEPRGHGVVRLRGLAAVEQPGHAGDPGHGEDGDAEHGTGTEPPTGVGADIERFVPPPLRHLLAAGEVESEHRRATVAFVGFAGVDPLLRRDRADELHDRLQELTTTVMDGLSEHGLLLTSADVGVDGGSFMLTAGAPEAVGDEEARMLRVARRVVEADCGLQVTIGANAGNVFTGAVGAPHRRTYSTMGDTTNLAARVRGRAGDGEVVATAPVLEVVRDRFEVHEVPPFPVRGRVAPVQAGLVGRATSGGASGTGSPGPFIGRDDELAVLLDALEQARAGRGRVVEVRGRQGIGSSRLVAELCDHAPDLPWLVAACEPYERTSPYHAANTLLRRTLGIPITAGRADVSAALTTLVDRRAPALRDRLPLVAAVVGVEVAATPETAEIDPRFRRQRTVEAVADLVATVAPPLAGIVIEDSHRMDDASAEVVAELLRRVPQHAWLAILTRDRPGDQGLHAGRGYDATVLDLQPLDERAAAELARRLAEQHPVPPHLLPDLVARSEGNPLFLTELVAAQADTGSHELPRSVEGIIGARIDALAPDDRRTLRYVSVLGDRFALPLVESCLGELGIRADDPAQWARLDRFLDRTSGDGLAFRSALVRDVAYEGLPYARRRQLHGRVAEVLAASDSRSDHALLPLHLTRAGHWADAWRSGVAAAERALAHGANAVAGELYDLALAAAANLPELDRDEVLRVALDAGGAWSRAGLADRALAAYTRANGVASDLGGHVAVLTGRAQVHERMGAWPQALRLYARVLGQVGDLPVAQRPLRAAEAHGGYATTRLAQDRPEDALEHALAAAEAAAASDDPVLQARSLHLLDRTHVALGRLEEATRFRDQALPLFAAVGDLPAQGTVLHDLAADAERTGQLEVALWLYERSAEVRERAGDVGRAAAAVNAIGEVLLALDRPDDARERFLSALRTWRGVRSQVGVATASRNLGRVALGRGDAPAAVRVLEEAARVSQEVGSDLLVVCVQEELAEAYLAVGRHVEAWDAASRVVRADCASVSQRARGHRIRAGTLEATGGLARARTERARAEACAPSTRQTVLDGTGATHD